MILHFVLVFLEIQESTNISSAAFCFFGEATAPGLLVAASMAANHLIMMSLSLKPLTSNKINCITD
jgi:hypothetical protein